jgi:hypothetical protein
MTEENPENNFLPSPLSVLEEGAAHLNEMYNALIGSGFNEEQALKLTAEIMKYGVTLDEG